MQPKFNVPFLLCAFLVVIGLPAGLCAQESSPQPIVDKQVKGKDTITLTIELPGEVEVTYKALVFSEEMTVLDALTSASKHSRPLRFKHTGSGEFAFLTELENVKNEGASGKNWTYKVDGQRAKVGMGGMKLKAGSHVLWIFGS
jgi:hypothetical protein